MPETKNLFQNLKPFMLIMLGLKLEMILLLLMWIGGRERLKRISLIIPLLRSSLKNTPRRRICTSGLDIRRSDVRVIPNNIIPMMNARRPSPCESRKLPKHTSVNPSLHTRDRKKRAYQTILPELISEHLHMHQRITIPRM